MLNYSPTSIHCNNVPSPPPLCTFSLYTSFLSSSSSSSSSSLSVISSPLPQQHLLSFHVSKYSYSKSTLKPKGMKVMCLQTEPLKVMISGAPASGKGTQCEMIVQKFGLVHISTGDLLRAEVSAGTEIGNKAKEYMSTGRLVPDEIVTTMVTTRLSQKDVKEKGWLLDGYPRSFDQAQSLEKLKIRPDIYVVLDVLDEILINRCVGRRLDPVTGKIYHIKNFPPETEEIKARLITRPDDTEEKVKSRLQIYKQNVEAILSTYMDILKKINGNQKTTKLGKSALQKPSSQEIWRGIPTRLNNIPHSREIREYFYDDVLQATQRAVNDGKTRLKVRSGDQYPRAEPRNGEGRILLVYPIICLELTISYDAQDVYRIGTLMELVRVLALNFADDGKRIKVCVQGSMGEGALAGMPLQLAGTRTILEYMDWGDYGAMGNFINIGSIGGKEVTEQDDLFILVAPQNAVGNCIIDDLRAMTDAAGNRPVILINPRLKTMGRDKRLEYAASFEHFYHFRLLYYAGTQYPIMGALRMKNKGTGAKVLQYCNPKTIHESRPGGLTKWMSYPYGYELYKRVDDPSRKEKYIILSTFPKRPDSDEINDAFEGKPRNQAKKASGIWGFLSGVF
ncbi:unnamed protein product [Camellia sinensis]